MVTSYLDTNRVVKSPPLTGYLDTNRVVKSPPLTGYLDTSRIVKSPPLAGYLDTSRIVKSPPLAGYLDTSRVVKSPPLTSYLDTSRVVKSPPLSCYLDTSRTVKNNDIPFTTNADTCRKCYSLVIVNVDTKRPIIGNFIVKADTERKLTGVIAIPFSINTDTRRNLSTRFIVNADTNRKMSIPTAFNFKTDTSRKLTKLMAFNIIADTSRKSHGKFSFKSDTTRELTVVLDPSFKSDDMGVKSISIVTGVQSLSDRFTVETVGKSFGGVDNFKGEVAGFEFEFQKATASRSTNSMGTTYTVQGRPDMGDLLYRPVLIYKQAVAYNGGLIINATAKELCAILGIVADITDFYPLGIGTYDEESNTFMIREKTVKSFLDKLFGWSSEFADRQMYYFNRNGKIVVREVGRYTTNYNLDDASKYRVENSTSNEQRIRKFVDYSYSDKPAPEPTKGKDTVTPFSCNIGFSGSTTFGDANLYYSSGYLMSETTAESSTSYNYEPALYYSFASNKNVLKSKVTLSNKGESRTTTTYEYDVVASSVYSSANVDATLTSERTIVETKSKGSWELESDHRTTHVPLGNGFYGQRVEEIDGEKYTTVATSISRGSAGGLASMYTVQLVNGWTHEKEDPTLPPVKDYDGELVTGYSIPVADIPTLNSLIQKINWMNGKIEETISLSLIIIPGADLVDAVGGVITYQGKLYYPQSTNAVVNERGTRQQINAVRWY